MIASLLSTLIEINLAIAASIGAVLLVREPVRRKLGPDATYLLWMVVPAASLAVLIPERTILGSAVGVELDRQHWSATLPFGFIAMLVIVWVVGAVVMAALMVRRQRLFLDEVELGQAGPAVVGFFYPFIVTPRDFAQRFDPSEQKLILAHEEVHLERGDARVNTLVALTRCLCWFNPLVHFGAARMRADQEMSCDATVIDRRPRNRRAYAETLLKTHLAPLAPPAGCHWPAEGEHPLTQRIEVLTQTPLSHPKRMLAASAIMAAVMAAGVAAWAAQPAREIPPLVDDQFYILWFKFGPVSPDDIVAFEPMDEAIWSSPPKRPAAVTVVNAPPDLPD